MSFTLETDGRLPSGDTLRAAIERTDEATGSYPAHYMINCAHPTHFDFVLEAGAPWTERVRGLRANASTRSHAELDEAPDLDAGDPVALGGAYRQLRPLLPRLAVVGGCCGTDAAARRGDLRGADGRAGAVRRRGLKPAFCPGVRALAHACPEDQRSDRVLVQRRAFGLQAREFDRVVLRLQRLAQTRVRLADRRPALLAAPGCQRVRPAMQARGAVGAGCSRAACAGSAGAPSTTSVKR